MPLCTSCRSKSPELSIHTFPSDPVQRKKCLVAIHRDVGSSFNLTSNTVVCSAHFLPSNFASSVPETTATKHSSATVASADSEGGKPAGERKRRYHFLKPKAVPSVFAFKPPQAVRPSPAERAAAQSKRRGEVSELSSALPKHGPLTEIESLREELRRREETIRSLSNEVASLKEENAALRNRVISFENLTTADRTGERFEFYTGMTREYWDLLWQYLEPSAENVLSQVVANTEAAGRRISFGRGRPSKLSLEDQLLLTILRLQHGRVEQDLAYVFGIHQSNVSRILAKWINYLSLRLGDIQLMPSWQEVEASLLIVFREAYPSTFCILDATELLCEIPSSLSLLSQHLLFLQDSHRSKGSKGSRCHCPKRLVHFCE